MINPPAPEVAPKAAGQDRGQSRRRRLRALIWLFVTVTVGVVAVLWIARFMLFARHATSPDDSIAARVPGLERLWIKSPEGPVEAWLLPGKGASAQTPGPAVIFAHGNAELIEHWPPMMEPYRQRGLSVLLVEYRGYGRSAGSPSEAAIAEDFAAFYDLLAARPEVDPDRIIFHGRSLGGAAVCALAARRPPAALILQSTFTRFTDMAATWFVPAFMILDPFDSLGVVQRLDRPTLVFHGRLDTLIPHNHGQRLAAASPRARLVSYDCGHNDCPPDWGHFWAQIDAFLRDADILPETPP